MDRVGSLLGAAAAGAGAVGPPHLHRGESSAFVPVVPSRFVPYAADLHPLVAGDFLHRVKKTTTTKTPVRVCQATCQAANLLISSDQPITRNQPENIMHH